MKIIVALILAIALAYSLGVRIHPESFSPKVSDWLTMRKQDNLWTPKPKKRTVGTSAWGARPAAPATTTTPQPTASQMGQKASALARKATYASGY